MLEYITIPLSPSGGSSSGGGTSGITRSTADSLYLSKQANKLTALPSKTPIHQDDILLIEDSQDSNKKKKIKVSDLKTDLDDSEVWKPSIAYTSDNIFSFKTTNTTATFKNGEKIEANKVYLARYDSSATSSTTLTNIEMAKFVRINHDDAITAIWDKDKDTGIEFERTTDDDVMHFVQGGDDVMHIQNRRVGINGENPEQTLQVKSIISSRAAISAAVTNDSSTLGMNAPSLEIANLSANVGGYATINFTDGIRVSPSAMIATKITNKNNNYGDLEFWTRGATPGTRISIWASGQINLYENTRFYKGLMDKDGHLGSNGQILVSTGSQIDWVDLKAKRLQDNDNDTTIDVERTADDDIIYLKTNGADRLIVNKDGKIGLGTIASLAQLEVRTNNNQGVIIQSGNGAGTSTRTQLGFGWQETNSYQHRIITEHSSGAKGGNKIHFNLWNQGVDAATTLGTLQVMTIVGDGRVGIMTNAPSQPLDVNGNIRLRSGLYDGDDTKGSNSQVLSSTGNKTKWVDLHINTISDSDNDTKITVEQNTDEDKIRFSVVGHEAMIIDENKNIGMGTSTPKMGLHVITNNRTSSLGAVVNGQGIGLTGNSGECRIYMEAANAPTDKKVFLVDCGSGSLTIHSLSDNAGSYTTQNILVAESGGNIGVGITPTTKLDINGQIRIRGGSPSDKKILTSDANGLATWKKHEVNRLNDNDNDTFIDTELTADDDTIVMATAGANRLIIKNNGSVGIGISPSTVSLDVNTNNGQALLLRAGNGSGASTRTQISFGWQESNTYQHRIMTEHNSGASSGNKIIFKLWNQGVDTAATLGSLQVMTIAGNGRVGIMTSEPTQRLDVNGNARLRSGLYDGDNVKGSGGQVLSTTGNKTKWINLHKDITVHNASATVALKSTNHLGCEAHVESTNNYTINGSDWNDGDEFNIINTTGSTVACNLVVSGFTGAYLRDGSTTNITSLNIGEQDASFLVRVTENPLNSGTKYLNVTRLNRFQVFKKELSSYIMVSDDKIIDDKKLVINTSGTAPTYQMKSGGTLQDLSTAVIGNGKIDDDIKSIAVYVNGLKIPRGRYTKDSAEQVTVDVSNVISGNWISKDTEIEIVR